MAIGSFVGVYCALSLFATVHKPPMHPFGHHAGMKGCPMQVIYHKQFRDNGDFHKKNLKELRGPFEVQRPEVSD